MVKAAATTCEEKGSVDMLFGEKGSITTAVTTCDAECQTDDTWDRVRYVVIKSHTMHYLQKGDEEAYMAGGC